MRGVPYRPPGGQDNKVSPTEGHNQRDIIESVPFYPLPRARYYCKVASASAVLLAVAAVVFVVLRCHARIVQKARTSLLAKRRLAAGDEDDDSKPLIGGSPKVCEGLAEATEQQVQGTQGALLRRRRRRDRTTPANAGGAQARRRQSPGKTEKTLKVLMKMAMTSAELWESSHSSESSEKTRASPSTSTSEEEMPHIEEAPPKKKKKSEESASREAPTAEAKPSTPGEPSTSSGGLGGEELPEIPPSLLEAYIQDTLQSAEESFIADWLIDSDEDVPLSPTPLGEEADHFPAGETEPDAPPFYEGTSLTVDDAAPIVTGQAQQGEVVQTPSAVSSTSSSDQLAHGAALPLPEASSDTEVRRLRKPNVFLGFEKHLHLSRREEGTACCCLTSPLFELKSLQTIKLDSLFGGRSTSAASETATSLLLIRLLTAGGATPSQRVFVSRVCCFFDSQPSPMAQHPFYRLPHSSPDAASLKNVDFNAHFNSSPVSPLNHSLNSLRRILAQQEVSRSDLLSLQMLGTQLMRHVGRYFKYPLKRGRITTTGLVIPLALRVLLGHYLLVVCKVVGPSMQKELWWNSRMHAALTPPAEWRPSRLGAPWAKTRGKSGLVQMLMDAMLILRGGEMLPAELIVPIMQKLFCSPYTLQYFQKAEWNGWRRADRRFLNNSPEDSTSSDDDEDQ
ncbi:hypothetical protein Esti_006602 [Eimeria stiedai]